MRGSEASSLEAIGRVRNYVSFGLGAVGRHKLLSAAIFLLFAGAVFGWLYVMPRTWRVQATAIVLPSEYAPGSTRPPTNGMPVGLAQAAADALLARAQLEALTRQYALLDSWDRSRPILFKWKDLLVARVTGEPPDPAERVDALIKVLQKQLLVVVDGNQVTLTFDWPESSTAVAVVASMQQRLMESRFDAEIAPLEDKAAVLDARVRLSQERIDTLILELEQQTEQLRKGAKPSTLRGMQAEGRWRDLPDRELMRLREAILSQRKLVREQEDLHLRKLTELKALLTDQQATLGPGHYALAETRDRIQLQEKQQARIDVMKAEEQRLLEDFVLRGGKDADLSSEPTLATWPVELRDDNERLAYRKARLAMELQQLQNFMADSTQAQAVVAEARAAFDQRYTVVQPALPPRKPISPNVPALAIAGLLGAALLAGFAAISVDTRSRRIYERWQVEDLVEVPLLAEVRLS
ncbi:MAG: hypothetical protein WBV82_29335 [Myxococcaceae bacterium]